MKMAAYWTTCWTCEEKIMHESQCFYVKTKDINIKICPSCNEKFKDYAKSILRIEKKKLSSVASLLSDGLELYHEQSHDLEEEIEECTYCKPAIEFIRENREEVARLLKKMNKDQ